VAFGGRSQAFRTSGINSGFSQVSGGAYAALTFTGDVRDGPNAVFTFTQGDGTVAVFRPIGRRGSAECSASLRCGYVSQITKPDGTVLTFGYDSPGGANGARLRSVTSSRGYALLLEYDGKYVGKACLINLAAMTMPAGNVCPTGVPTATYGYDTVAGDTRLSTVTDPTGAVWGFVNTANAQGFVKPGQSAAWLTNQIWHRLNDDDLVDDIVTAQDYADGQHYSYSFAYGPERSGHVPALAGGWYVDSANNRTTVEYDFPAQPGTGPGDPCFTRACSQVTQDPMTGDTSIVYQMTPGPVRVTDALNRVTSFVYCDPAQMARMTQYRNKCYVTAHPVSSTDPSGIVTVFTWDGYGNLTDRRQKAVAGSNLDDIVRKASYTCGAAALKSCEKPTTVTDALGRTTRYDYAPEHGGILAETRPGVNGVSAQKRYAYQQRTAWIANGAGGWVAAGPPAWVLTRTSFCKKGAASGDGCATPGDEVVTTYDYGPDSGPNNLLLRGILVDPGGLALRTCFAYDARGNKISETKPRGGLASCP
jgi:YD repeat-containing protein